MNRSTATASPRGPRLLLLLAPSALALLWLAAGPARVAPAAPGQLADRDATTEALAAYEPAAPLGTHAGPVACGSTNPPLALAILRGGSEEGPAVVGLHETPGDDPAAQRVLALRSEVGAVYGLAWDDAGDALYAAAYHKRGVAFGPGGPGAIYRLPPASGQGQAQAPPSLFASLPAGPDHHELDRDDDAAAASYVGRTSLGDLEVNDAGDELFAANLYDGRIYRISLPDGRVLGSFDHGAAGEHWRRRARLFALAWHEGWLYHGVMDSQADSADATPTPFGQRPPPGPPTVEGPAAHVYRSRADGSEMEEVLASPLALPSTIWQNAWLRQVPALVDLEILEGDRIALGIRNRRLDEASASTGLITQFYLPIGALLVHGPGGLRRADADPTVGGSLARIPGLDLLALPFLRASAQPDAGLPIGQTSIHVEWKLLEGLAPLYREVVDQPLLPAIAPGDLELLCARGAGLDPDLEATVTAEATAGGEATIRAASTAVAGTREAIGPTLTAQATNIGPTQTAQAATATALARIPPERRTRNVIEQSCAEGVAVYAVTCFVYGTMDTIQGIAARAPAIAAFDGRGKPIELVEYAAVGTVHGLAYDRPRGHLYAGAWYTQNALVGPSGGGAIYRVDLETGQTVTWQQLAAGPTIYPSMTIPGVTGSLWAGRVGLGDIELSEDGSQLFAVNFFDRRIHRFRVSDGLPLPPIGIGSQGEAWHHSARPMGLLHRDGWLYHGVVDSGELAPGALRAFVYRSRADGSEMAAVAELDLNGAAAGFAGWWPWTERAGAASGRQPLIGDLELTDEGDLVVGMHDRRADAFFGTTPYGDLLLLRRLASAPGEPPRFGLDPGHFRLLGSSWPWGSLAADPFRDTLVSSASSPIERRTSGALWYGEETGQVLQRQTIARGAERFAFGGLPVSRKMPQGLGDVESLCDAPVLPTPTTTPSPSPSPTATPSATPTRTPTPSATPTATPTPTPEPRPIYLPISLRETCRSARQRSDVALVLDTSSSMRGRKIVDARAAAAAFVDAMDLGPGGDQVAVVRFDSEAELTQPLSADRAIVQAAIAGLQTRSGTRIDQGLLAALAEMRSERRVLTSEPVIVLMTDGVQTIGLPSDPLDAARSAREAGVTLFTIGLGADVDEATLLAMAGSPERYRYAPDSGALAEIYADIAKEIRCPEEELWPQRR